VKTILIKDFVSNDEIATKEFTTFNGFKFIKKGSTGIGGTTSVLNIKDQNVVIISPLKGMIASKEQKHPLEHQFFIYGNSNHKWKDAIKYIKSGKTAVINTTPEQILEVKKNNKDIYNVLLAFNFFIDESDILSNADYRASLKDFYSIIFNEIEGGVTLSTATEIYNHLDIPLHVKENMCFCEIKREEEQVKDLVVEPLSNWFNFIKEETDKGNKVVLFTNEFKQIKNIIMATDLSGMTQTLLGDVLHTKIAKAKAHTLHADELNEKSILDPNAQIYVLSKKYLIGFDIEFDCSIGIIADQNSETNALNYNEIIQAYGRARKGVNVAKLFYNSTNNTEVNIEATIKEIKAIEYNDNHLANIQPLINSIHNYLTYSTCFEKTMKENGFNLTYNNDIEQIIRIRLPFREQYRNLILQEDYLLRKQLETIYNHINGDLPDYNGFDRKHLLLYATAYLAVRTNNLFLLSAGPSRYSELLETAKTFVDINLTGVFAEISKTKASKKQLEMAKDAKVDDKIFQLAITSTTDNSFMKAIHIINHLYVINKVENQEIDDTTKTVMNGFEIASKVVVEDFTKYLVKLFGEDWKNNLDEVNEDVSNSKLSIVFKNTNRAIINALDKELSGMTITQDIFTQIFKKADDIKSSLLKNKTGVVAGISSNTYSIDKQIENHKNYVLSLLSLICSGHMFGFKTNYKDNREFNTITKCTRQLRSYTAYEMYQADISSAFATFVDNLTGSQIASEVYVNIMNKYKCDRPAAKVAFNAALNDASRNRVELHTFFKNCGYNQNQISRLIELVKVEKGAFYRSMTRLEEAAIEEFKNANDLGTNAVRCHDALFWIATQDRAYKTEFKTIKFDLKKI
jgi:hypothetical protein